MKKFVGLVLALVAAALLSACGTSSSSGEAARMVAGQVADYSGPAGELEASAGLVKLPEAGTGSVEADGTFSFEFEDIRGFTGLPLVPPGTCADLSLSDAEARGLSVGGFDVVVEGRVTGTLTQSSEAEGQVGGAPVPEISISRAYVDRDVTVKGTCTLTVLGARVTTTHNVTYQRGWNAVLTKTTFSDDGSADARVTSATPSDLESVGWTY